MSIDPNQIGQGRQYNDACDAYDAAKGKHVVNPPEDVPEDSKFATGNMPKAPDPSPFKVGGQAAGE